MGSKIISQAAWIMILVVFDSKRGKATLDIKPSDTVVLLNGSNFFNCSTFNFSSNSEEIVWYHYSVSSDQRKEVYEDGETPINYESRFRVEKDLSKGVVNLIVESPTFEDAGTYECQDGKGFGETARAQLIVLETEPVCQSNIQKEGVIGSNDCGIQPDQVEMSCSITYHGNIPVHLEWRNGLENDNSSPTVECSNKTDHSTCNLTVAGDRTRNNSSYICEIKDTGTNAYSCSSDVIKILYVTSDNTTISKSDEDEFRCSANSSQPCTYTWYSDGTIVSESESLKPTKNGQYLCNATCNIRGQTCVVTAGNLNVAFETTTYAFKTKSSKAGIIAGIVVPLFIATIAAIVLAVVAQRRYKQQKQKRDDDRKEKLILQVKQKENGNNFTDAVDSVNSDESVIQKAFNANAYVGKGLIGEIYGPGQYKGKLCACERIMFSTDQLIQANEGEMTKEEKIRRNGRRWMDLDHDNLVKFYDVLQQSPAVFIIMEYTAGGYVRKALNKYTEDLQVPVVIDWATQIAQGMNYLHENGIVHRGLKCSQILITEPFDPPTSAHVTLKVASYSLNFEIDKSNPVTFKGMFAWMAPEAISKSKHSNYSDIWSYGVTVWEILTRGIPYSDKTAGEIVKGIPRGKLSLKIPGSCPKVLRHIFKECFHRERKRRPAFSKILTRLRSVDYV